MMRPRSIYRQSRSLSLSRNTLTWTLTLTLQVNLVALGSCGAFVHGLEDECLSVRSASVEALTKLSIGDQELAMIALDFLVDMFNDEIEQVRLKAIESLTAISRHILLQVPIYLYPLNCSTS